MPTSWTALAITLLAIAPGFILTTLWSRARTWKGGASDFRTVLQSVALSAVVQALLVPLTVAWIVPARDDLAAHAWKLAAWSILAVLVLPCVLGLGVARLQDWVWPIAGLGDPATAGWRGRLSNVLRAPVPPTVWDSLFTRLGTSAEVAPFLVVKFKDGSHIGGVFAQGSLALTSPEPQGLYLISEWVLDDDENVEQPIPATRGILVPTTADVRWIRVLDATSEEPNNGAAEERATRWRKQIQHARWRGNRSKTPAKP